MTSAVLRWLGQRAAEAVRGGGGGGGAPHGLLAPPLLPLLSQAAAFKVKASLRRRCKACYVVFREARAYVVCPKHPKHKQMALVKKEKHTWTLTDATQSRVRPW